MCGEGVMIRVVGGWDGKEGLETGEGMGRGGGGEEGNNGLLCCCVVVLLFWLVVMVALAYAVISRHLFRLTAASSFGSGVPISAARGGGPTPA